jgi:hypothetical protein
MAIQLSLEVEEVNAILNVLGELPSKTGAYPLILKIKEQGDSQAKPTPEEAEVEVVA